MSNDDVTREYAQRYQPDTRPRDVDPDLAEVLAREGEIDTRLERQVME